MHAGMRERDLSGVALAAPESALGGWKGVITSLLHIRNLHFLRPLTHRITFHVEQATCVQLTFKITFWHRPLHLPRHLWPATGLCCLRTAAACGSPCPPPCAPGCGAALPACMDSTISCSCCPVQHQTIQQDAAASCSPKKLFGECKGNDCPSVVVRCSLCHRVFQCRFDHAA